MFRTKHVTSEKSENTRIWAREAGPKWQKSVPEFSEAFANTDLTTIEGEINTNHHLASGGSTLNNACQQQNLS